MKTHRPYRFIPLLLGILLCAADGIATAQIEVAPTRVILTMREHSQEVNVTNTSDNQVEVNAELGFKLIRTDSLGEQTLDAPRTPEEQMRSGRDWVKIFPRRFTLAPRSSRLIRVLVTIPDSAGAGEYWARLIVAGTPVNSMLPVDLDSAAGIETDIRMRMELDLPIIIRKGSLETGIRFNAVQAQNDSPNALLLLDLQRTGNSAYRGTLHAVLRDAGGDTVTSTSDQYTAEFNLRKAIRLPRLADGSYTLEIESQSVKRGGANDAVIPAPDVARRYALDVSGDRILVAAKE